MPSLNDKHRARLEYLLLRREQLNDDEWYELSQLVKGELLNHQFPEYNSLPLINGQPEDPQLIVESFIYLRLKRSVKAKNYNEDANGVFEIQEQYRRFLVNDGALNILWRHRSDPIPPDKEKKLWENLYRQVYRILSPYNFSSYQALANRFSQKEKNLKAHLISRFFADKILLPAKRKKAKSQHMSKSYLYRMYENWLVDMIRQPLPQAATSENSQANGNEISGNDTPLDIFKIYGISPECVYRQAMAFLEAVGRWEILKKKNKINWIRIFLIEHHCAPNPIPMSQLASNYQIPAYHNKAQKLGITSARGGFPNMSDFEATNLGQWVRSLLEDCTQSGSSKRVDKKLSRSGEDRKFITKALDFMCLAALKFQNDASVQ